MGKTAIEAKKRSDTLWMDPEKLVIVGLDTEEGPEHPLYDERIHLPVTEVFVDNIAEYGVIEPVIVRKNGDSLEVVDGRRRVRGAREANKRKGVEVSVPTMFRREPEQSGFLGVVISLNEQRVDDNALVKAKKAQRMLNAGKSEQDVARAFGVTRVAIGQWVKLLDLALKVQRAVEAGKIAASAAATLVDLTHEEQEKKLEEMIAAGATSVTEAKRQRQGRRSGRGDNGQRGQRPSVKTLRVLNEDETFIGDLSNDCRHFLQWLLGGGEAHAKKVKGLWKALTKEDANDAE